jgi:hypothetical protein
MDSEKLKMECVSFPTYKEDNKSYFAVLFTWLLLPTGNFLVLETLQLSIIISMIYI